MSRLFNQAELRLLHRNYRGRSVAVTTEKFNREFGRELTAKQIREPDWRFMVCWISSQPDIAYVLDQDGFPLFADGVFDTAADIAKLWEAEQTFHA